MLRKPRILPILFVSVGFSFWSCGSNTSTNQTASMLFSPNPGTVASGVCTSKGQITEMSGTALSFLSSEALFTDGNNQTGRFTLDATALSSIFGSGILPAHGAVTGSFSFDLNSKGLALPSNGTVVVIGTGNGVVITFVGTLQCTGSP